MKLWELSSRTDLPDGENPWEPWYDKAFAFVIRAESEEKARQIAHENGGDENRGVFSGEKIANTQSPWLDSKYSVCAELSTDGDVGVVVRDFASA